MRAISCGFESHPRHHFMAKPKLPDKDFKWSPELAYVIGLIVTDGNLSKNGRQIAMRSSEYQLLKTFKKCLNIPSKTNIKKTFNNGFGKKPAYRIQISNVQFYRWLLKIGLFPNKTYTIGALQIPNKYFPDFLRGHLDGDGSISFYEDKYNEYKGRIYKNNRLFLRFISASPIHMRWLQSKVEQVSALKGALFKSKTGERKNRRVPMWTLKFSKKESINLLKTIYYKPDLPSLNRKKEVAILALNIINNEKRKKYSWVNQV